MEDFTKECPYCGQANLTGEDARKYCGCKQARKYRRIMDALEKQGDLMYMMDPINEDVLYSLKQFADLICAELVEGITVKLEDGSTIVIGAKVSRSKRFKVEEKVDE